MTNVDEKFLLAKQVLGQIKLGILAGGYSSESHGSITNAHALLPYFQRVCQSAAIIEYDGKPSLATRLAKCDFVLNICYGVGGEDGQIQGLMSSLEIPYSGSPVLASAIGMDKNVFKAMVRNWGFATPNGRLVSSLDPDLTKNQDLGRGPFVVKPLSEGDSEGVVFVDSLDNLAMVINDIPKASHDHWMVEEYIQGDHGTVSMFRDEDGLHISDAIVFDLPDGHRLYDQALKYRIDNPISIHLLDPAVGERLEREISMMYMALQCEGVTRFDYVIRSGTPHYLEINTIPGLYPGSNSSRCFSSTMSFEQFLYISTAANIRRCKSSSTRRLYAKGGDV
ncbi:D-alanine--D-alanine ligase [Burkholderia ambifaria]|uniref:D-alanine--D-alanine ligase n=1 Tax=Burkholderia ambifaria MEX-5 TaxID=396597 RepID=B1T475_9BURK|nr:D-alanine--D-alanine ligase [Burkholderia ambifaria]EDT41630.1 D-alanine--D-alanine ligase [Burkholderia ambifaria MEX-5]